MDGSKKRFIIPVYQRNYDWKTENCKQLYDDLVKVVKNHRSSHFFGSLVSVYESSGRNTEFLVIDGQQRLTTVSLLLLAMYNLISKGLVEAEEKTLANQIYEDFLVDKYQPEETRIKLKPVKNDRKAFDKLFNSEDEYIRDSNLTTNYNYFYERIKKQEVTVDELFDAVCKLEIINITLNNDDNPQLIFESLNSTGLDLSEGDKIRNFILMGLSTNDQNDYYEKYWNKIEICTKYDVSSFIRDYLSIKQQAIPSQKKVYINFKEFVEYTKIETEELLKDMLAYAKRYQILLNGNGVDKELNACIYRLNRLETTVTRPFFLEILRLFDENKLSINDITEIFLTTENYLFRRNICDLPTNALNKIFLMLHREIIRYDGTDDNYVSKFKYTLLAKKDRARFPNNDEFARDFVERQIYSMNSKNKIYILERIENFGTVEDKEIYAHCDDGTYSIEHIMPQHLTPLWQKELGENYELVYEEWLHRIANLTLTAYNSKYSNSSFEEKKNMQNGFLDSGIRMNTYIAQKDKWTLIELKERSDYLKDRALQIWSLPTTNYLPAEKEMDSVTLDEDISLSGRQIVRFSFKKAEQPVTSWVDMYERVVKLLHTDEKSVLNHLAAQKEDYDLSVYFSDNKNTLRSALQIDENIYTEKNTSTDMKLSILRRLVKLYDVDPNDFVFYLRDENEENEDEPGSRFELRRRYWTYALDFIHKAHGDKSFSNVNPTVENYISGFFGISGFSINCVANYDSARVEIYLGKSDKEINKKFFDKLVVNKEKIEAKLGISLSWNRNDEAKASKVFNQLNNVSIGNEVDWLQMARFHAEWSKKFYDVIVPYLR